MPIVAVIAAAAAVVWGAILARRGSLVIGCALFLIISYVVGYEFWNTRLGPLPISLDRVVLVGLIAACAVQWRSGKLNSFRLTGGDWMLGALVTVLVANAILCGQPDPAVGAGSVWGRLITSIVLPAILYLIARVAPISRRNWSLMLAALSALGVYLAFTAVCEIMGQWSFIFPRYIADPGLGIHFGRSRGPDLNAASLGLYLTACIWCCWTLFGQTPRRDLRCLLLTLLPLMACGVLLTYTRSTWMGLAASALVVGGIQIPPRWRVPSLSVAALAGSLVVAMSWSQLIGLEREGTAGESEHSVGQRESFTYVSWQMFKDHPLLGVGYGRFFDQKLPYLSDRSQDFELESIRPLHHHNTLLSVLTETGLVGLITFLGLLAAWIRSGWQLMKTHDAPHWKRAHGLLMVALIVNYLCSALFHDLALVPAQHSLLFIFAGLTINLQQHAAASPAPIHRSLFVMRHFSPGHSSLVLGPWSLVTLFGMNINRVTMRGAVSRLLTLCLEHRGEVCRYVVTPNVDHAVLFQRRADLRAAYADASLVLADGAPIVLASHLVGQPLPERVAGSDLVPQLFTSTTRRIRVFLLGAAPGIAAQAARNIARQWSHVEVVGTYSPPIGFENEPAENARIIAMVNAAAPDLLILGFGAPKQELWIHKYQHELNAKVALCVGATIDFLAGQRRRSPVWMRRAGLEWLYRVWSEPRRLASRYARDAWIFPQLVWRQLGRSSCA